MFTSNIRMKEKLMAGARVFLKTVDLFHTQRSLQFIFRMEPRKKKRKALLMREVRLV